MTYYRNEFKSGINRILPFFYYATLSCFCCNKPCTDCLTLHGVNPNQTNVLCE